MCKNGSTAQVQLTIGNKMQTFGVQELDQNEDGYYCISAEVSAAQMNDSIAVTVVNGATTGCSNNPTTLSPISPTPGMVHTSTLKKARQQKKVVINL